VGSGEAPGCRFVRGRTDLVFCRLDGRYLDPDTVSQTFERLVAKSGADAADSIAEVVDGF
jgi:hypothetical protein